MLDLNLGYLNYATTNLIGLWPIKMNAGTLIIIVLKTYLY